MTVDEIAKQIAAATEKAIDRASLSIEFESACSHKPRRVLTDACSKPRRVLTDDILREVTAAYLSGVNQAAHFLVVNDGEVTPQQVEQAVLQVGNALNLTLDKP